jgi:hypothetical protein
MMMKEKEFIKHIRSHLKEYGFKLVFGRGKRVNVGNARCGGYFIYHRQKKDRKICVAKKGESWLYVLAHEYCHFLQWLDQPEHHSKRLDDAQNIVNNVCVGFVDANWTAKQIRNAFRLVAENERDCERRTVKLLEYWGISFNKDMYIKKANLYVYLHHMWMEHHAFNLKFDVYKSNKILNAVQGNFKVKSHLVVPKYIREELNRAFS